MKVRLLIATGDGDYAEHLSERISSHHADVLEVSVCRTFDLLDELLKAGRFDTALLDASWVDVVDLDRVHLPMLLWTQDEAPASAPEGIYKLRKYQRVSTMVETVMEQYAIASVDERRSELNKAFVTAVWSPAGGVGKTTVALAYAVRLASLGKQAMYLCLESFSSVPAYYSEAGKGISAVFEMLENREGNVGTLIRGIQKHERELGITYLCCPDNFDDMNILTPDNVGELVASCAGVTEELVIDLSCACDERSGRVFELADKVLVVIDQGFAVQAKLEQFSSQHSVYEAIKPKVSLVVNKGASAGSALALFDPAGKAIRLPFIQTSNSQDIYRALACAGFDS